MNKLFSCKNKECVSNTPNDAKSNKIKEAILSFHALNVKGDPIEDADPIIDEVYYCCGVCGDDAEEVPYDSVMKVKFVEREKGWLYGKYKNTLRGSVYDFRIGIINGEVQIADLKPRKLEVQYIQEEFKNSYMSQIEAEVIDVETNKFGGKVYEVSISNPIEGRSGTVYIENDIVIDILNDELKDFEIKKAKQVVRESMF